MKRITVFLLSSLLAVSLAACGGGASAGTEAAEKAAESSGNNASEGKEETVEKAAEALSTAVIADETTADEKGAVEETAPAAEETGNILDPSVQYKEGEETLVETDRYAVKVTGYDPAYHYEPEDPENDRNGAFDCFAVSIRFENRSEYLFESEGAMDRPLAAVNRNQGLSPVFQWDRKTDDREKKSIFGGFEAAAGDSIDGRILIPLEKLAGAGITSVDEIRIQISGTFKDENVLKEYVRCTAAMYPTGKSAEEITPSGRMEKEQMTVLADREGVLVGFLPGETDEFLHFYVENDTEENVRVVLSDRKINGTDFYMVVGGEKHPAGSGSVRLADLLPGCHAAGVMAVDKNGFMKENGFAQVTEFGAELSVYKASNKDSGSSMKERHENGDEIFSESIHWTDEQEGSAGPAGSAGQEDAADRMAAGKAGSEWLKRPGSVINRVAVYQRDSTRSFHHICL